MPSSHRYLKFWVSLSGAPAEFPLNARIFHSVCLISIVALSYNVPFNYAIGLPEIGLASFLALLICSSLYYASRFKNQVEVSIFITNLFGLGLFTYSYFLNSGQRGPTILFFLLFLILSISISPSNQYKFWIPLNILIVIGLNTFEYVTPGFIPDTYEDQYSQLIDNISAYVVVALIIYFCTDYIRRSYEKEKSSAVEKSKAIEQKNRQILLQNKELQRLNGENNKLMSIVAHDLRSPLGSIQNFLELLTQFDLEADKRQEIEKGLLNATTDTLSMLTKLLDWSRSQLYGVSPKPEILNLQTLLAPTLRFEELAAANKGIVLESHFDPDTTLYADTEMMRLVVRNLISNAIKFTPAGGRIELRSEIRSANLYNLPDDECVISIRDNGIGISAERQEEMFSMHVQSTYGTRKEKGVGLGLLLCMEFVTAQNGKIWFESSQETGTCFYVAVPAHSRTVAEMV